MSDKGYAGDISPTEAFEILKSEADAELIDVRTQAEWSFVGVPDLSSIDMAASFIEWVSYPAMSVNADFVSEVEKLAGANKDAAVMFLCRSGQRSKSAAMAATAAGFTRAYNVEDGFEGALDAERHRGSAGGWKSSGLPWAQT